MRLHRFAILLFLFIGSCISNPQTPSTLQNLQLALEQKTWTLQEANGVCKNASQSLFFPFRCNKPTKDVLKGIHGTLFKLEKKVQKEDLSPVLLIPGFAGSSLEAELRDVNNPSWWCYKRSDWFRIWLALSELFAQSCWLHNLDLKYNETDHTYKSRSGVTTRPYDWGGVSGIDYMDRVYGFPLYFTSYYGTMIASLKELGYEIGKNLRGAPFDWRLPPSSNLEFRKNLKVLIERMYLDNNNTKVHVITHSMGGIMFNYFLNEQDKSWKDKYIASFIPIAAPWGGAAKPLRAAISGDTFGLTLFGYDLPDRLEFRTISRNLGGLAILFPDSEFWKNHIFVRTPNGTYTGGQIASLFLDIGANETAIIYRSVSRILSEMKTPDVPTHCLYGVGVPTEISYHYSTTNYDENPTTVETTNKGDGTVPLESLRICRNWSTKEKHIHWKEIELGEHFTILEDPSLIKYLLELVTNKK